MKLGKTQAGVLRALKKHKAWYRGAGWLWSTTSETERLMESLVRRGMVTVTEETFSSPISPPTTTKVYRANPGVAE